jgi:ElaB/YqjD/DUF883 family membrane-anchored ribosome-binding protein
MSVQSEKLAADIKVLVNDTEELVKATASQTGEKVVELRNRVQDAVTNIKPQLAKLETVVVDKAKTTVTAAETYLHENPWAAVGVSAGIGLVIGLLIGRR